MTLQEWKDKINNQQGFTQYEKDEYDRINRFFYIESDEKLKKSSNANFYQAFLRHLRNLGRVFSNDTALSEDEFTQLSDSFKEFGNLFAGENNENRKLITEVMSGSTEGFIQMLETLNERMDLKIDVEQWKQDREYYMANNAEQKQSDLDFVENDLKVYSEYLSGNNAYSATVVLNAITAADNIISGKTSNENQAAIDSFKEALNDEVLRNDIIDRFYIYSRGRNNISRVGSELMRFVRILNNRCNAGITEGKFQNELNTELTKENNLNTVKVRLNMFRTYMNMAEKPNTSAISDGIIAAGNIVENDGAVSQDDRIAIENFKNVVSDSNSMGEVLQETVNVEQLHALGKNGENLITVANIFNTYANANIDTVKMKNNIVSWARNTDLSEYTGSPHELLAEEEAEPQANTEVPKTEEQPTQTNAEVPKTEEQPTQTNTEVPKTEEQPTQANAEVPKTEEQPTQTNAEVPKTEEQQPQTNANNNAADIQFLNEVNQGFLSINAAQYLSDAAIISDAQKAITVAQKVLGGGQMNQEDIQVVNKFADTLGDVEKFSDLMAGNIGTNAEMPPLGENGESVVRFAQILNNNCNTHINIEQIQNNIVMFNSLNNEMKLHMDNEVDDLSGINIKATDIEVPKNRMSKVENVPNQQEVNQIQRSADKQFLEDTKSAFENLKNLELFEDPTVADDMIAAINAVQKAVEGQALSDAERQAANNVQTILEDDDKFGDIMAGNTDFSKENPPFGADGESVVRLAQLLNEKCGTQINVNRIISDIQTWKASLQEGLNEIKQEDPNANQNADVPKVNEEELPLQKQDEKEPAKTNRLPKGQPLPDNTKFVYDDENYSMYFLGDKFLDRIVNTIPGKNLRYKTTVKKRNGEAKTIKDIADESETEALNSIAKNNENYEGYVNEIKEKKSDIKKNPAPKNTVDPRNNRVNLIEKNVKEIWDNANKKLISDGKKDFSGFFGYRKNLVGNGNVQGWSGDNGGVVFYDNKLYNEKGVNDAKQSSMDISARLEEAANKAKDPVVKRFFNDRAYIADYRNGNIMKAVHKNPMINRMLDIIKRSPNYKTEDIKTQRKALGREFSDSANELFHYAAEEVKAEYFKQKCEDNGWNENNERNYLKILNSAHTKFLRNYDKLKKYNDMGYDGLHPNRNSRAVIKMNECIYNAFFTNILGQTGNANIETATSAVGYIRGEKAAIDLGWGVKELPILGALGAVGEEIDRLEKYGTEAQKEGLEDFKRDYITLKCDVMTKYVVTSKEKVERAEKIMDFLDKYKDNTKPGISKAMAFVNNSRGAFDEACREVNASVEKNRNRDEMIERDRLLNPLRHIKNLENEAKLTKNYKKFVNEMLYIEKLRIGKIGNGQNGAYKESICKQWDRYVVDTMQSNKLDHKMLMKELIKATVDNRSQYGDLLEQKSRDIRSGKTPVEARFDKIKTATPASISIADFMMDDTGLYGRTQALENINNVCSRHITGFAKFMNDNIDNYISKESVSTFTPLESKVKCNLASGGGMKKMEREYSIGYYAAEGQLHHEGNDETILRSFKSSSQKAEKYLKVYKKVLKIAENKLTELEELAAAKRDNSIEFERMRDSLTGLTLLDENSSPAQMKDALNNVVIFSNQYEDKIRKQGGGSIGNGAKRKTFSININRFARNAYQSLKAADSPYMNNYEPVQAQVDRIKTNYENQRVATLLDLPAKLEQAKADMAAAAQNGDNAAFENAMAEMMTAVKLKKDSEEKKFNEKVNKNAVKEDKKGKKANPADNEYEEGLSKGKFAEKVKLLKGDASFKKMLAQSNLQTLADMSDDERATKLERIRKEDRASYKEKLKKMEEENMRKKKEERLTGGKKQTNVKVKENLTIDNKKIKSTLGKH